MSAIRVGVIGYGYWGPNLARNFNELSTSELVVIADRKEEQLERARSKYPDVTLTKDYKDLFNMGLDAVIISTPPKTHYSIAKDCLTQNLHVLVEKPMTLDSQDAMELNELANAKKLTLMVGHIFEYNSAVIEMKNYIDSMELGDIYYIDTPYFHSTSTCFFLFASFSFFLNSFFSWFSFFLFCISSFFFAK